MRLWSHATKKQVTEWKRRHAIEPPVTLRVIKSPLDGWIVSDWLPVVGIQPTYPRAITYQREVLRRTLSI